MSDGNLSRFIEESGVARIPMSERAVGNRLEEETLRRRLAAFESNGSFFIQMWLQKPWLAAQAVPCIVKLPTPLAHASGAAGEST